MFNGRLEFFIGILSIIVILYRVVFIGIPLVRSGHTFKALTQIV